MRLFLHVVVVGALCALIALGPVAAFAQQMPQAPDGTSMNEPPAAGPQAAEDACGNTPTSSFGQTTPGGVPVDINDMNPKDVTGAQPIRDLSSVSGTVVHTAGNLVLLRLPMEPAAGMDKTTPLTPDHTLAVIRLPAGCTPALPDGSIVKATGMPTTDGILNAELIQSSQ